MKISQAEKNVQQAIKKYVRRGAKLLAACSGGADSIALTDALWRLQAECGYDVAVMHVEHGIRGQEALDDAEFVKNFCAGRGLNFVCRHVQAAEYAAQQGLSLEDAARRLRYKELFAYADAAGCAYVVTAHQADDQAETVLMQLLRGSGTAGLCGMQVQSGRLLRPLLYLRRSEIEAYCRERQLQYCHDSTNDDVHYTRNRIRRELLPYLEAKFNPQLIKALGQTARLLSFDGAFASSAAQKFYDVNVKEQGKILICSAEALKQAAAAVSTRVIRMMWERVRSGGELGFEHVESVLELLAKGSSGKIISLPGKTAAAYSYGSFYIGARQQLKSFAGNGKQPQAEFNVCIKTAALADGAAKINLPDGRTLHISVSEERCRTVPDCAAVPLELAGAEITVRTRRDGDRFYPYGSSGGKKLKDYFINNKIPRAERDKKLLVTAAGNVLWIVGERQAGWKGSAAGKWLQMRLETRKGADNEEKYC